MELENASWIEVENYLKKPNGILLSMGSTEQHGPIGLIGTDTICSYEIAKKVANKTKMYLAPKIAYSSAPFNMSFPGTISISEKLFKKFIFEIISSIFSHGFSFIYIINGHGANIKPIKELIVKFEKKNIFFKSWWDFNEVNKIRKNLYGAWEGMHATPSEISITKVNYRNVTSKNLLKLAKIPPQKLSNSYIKNHSGDRHGKPEKHKELFPDGRVGSHSYLSTKKAGRKLLRASIDEIVKDIKKIKKNINNN